MPLQQFRALADLPVVRQYLAKKQRQQAGPAQQPSSGSEGAATTGTGGATAGAGEGGEDRKLERMDSGMLPSASVLMSPTVSDAGGISGATPAPPPVEDSDTESAPPASNNAPMASSGVVNAAPVMPSPFGDVTGGGDVPDKPDGESSDMQDV